MADAGYDVWLANKRGVSHSQSHTHLDPEHNPEKYWDFSFAEIGMSDIPAMITGVKKQLETDHFYD